MERKYCVYLHVFPNNKFYVGITSRNILKRWGRNGSGYSEQPLIHRAIIKYGWENIKHIILHINLSPEKAKELETYYITEVYHSNETQYGYNLTNGGDGTVGYYPSAETRKKMSDKRTGKNNPNYGKSIPDYQRKILSEKAKQRTGVKNPFYGKHHSDETKKKISEAKLKQDLTGKRAHNSKPVRCIELNKIFESASLAAAWVGASSSTITNACRHGADFLSKGYHWEYV